MMAQMSWEESVQWLRDQPDQKDLVMACYFDDPITEAAERYWKSAEWKAIAKFLPRSLGRALDLGAGRGISSYAMARDGWSVTALEPDPSLLVGSGAIRTLSDQSGLNISIVSDFSEKLPFPDNHFDLVNCRQVLHHAKNLPQTCREIFRVLKPGGLMVATREHVISKKQDLPAFLEAHSLHKLYGGENAFLLEEYLSAIRSAGLTVKTVMAPLDSEINYFPMTPEDVFKNSTRRLRTLFGSSLTTFLFRKTGSLGEALTKALFAIQNWRDISAGRLYSFIALKP